MKTKNLHLKISILALLIYEISTTAFHLDGVSIFKLAVTALVWVSFGLAFYEFIKKHKILFKNIPTIAVLILILLLSWNFISILRSILTRDGSIITIIGNVFTSLSILIPFAIIYTVDNGSLKTINSYFLKYMLAGIPLFIILYLISGGSPSESQLRLSFILLQPVVFLIALLPFQHKKAKILILLGVALLFYVSSRASIRTMMIREILHFGVLLAVYLLHKFQFKFILVFSFLALLVPILLLQQGMVTGESPFEKYFSSSSDDEYSVDTRTFLYKEVYLDLIDNNRMIIGKGANGRYYSDYFSTVQGDSPIRLNIEVGFLGILLKGGMISVVLNLMLLIIAIYYAFFKSKNIFVISIGFILVVHVMLLFVENVISYSTYNFIIWYFIGICLSKTTRTLTNKQIKVILNTKKEWI